MTPISLNEFLGRLRDDVLKPIYRWVLARSWGTKAVILLGIWAVTFAMRNPAAVRSGFDDAGRLVLVLITEPTRPSLSKAECTILRDATRNLAHDLSPSLAPADSFDKQAWSSAQVMVASEGITQVDSSLARDYLLSQVGPKSSGWRKWKALSRPVHMGASAWCLYALASLRRPVPQPQIEFLFASQKQADRERNNGWWAIYPAASGAQENASTYATAMAVLALDELRRAGALARDSVRASIAIARGVRWLWETRDPDGARWWDYPAAEQQVQSVAVSGLVLHVLHRCSDMSLVSLDRLWLRSLPLDVPRPKTMEVCCRSLGEEDKALTDDTRYYAYPWAVIATVDAYQSGSLGERASASRWLERASRELDERGIRETAQAGTWVAAEVLISARTLLKACDRGSQEK